MRKSLFVPLSLSLSFSLSLSLSLSLSSISLSFYLPPSLSISLSLYIYLSLSLSLYIYICLSLSLSRSLSLLLSPFMSLFIIGISPYIYLSFPAAVLCIDVSMSLSLCLSTCFYIPDSISPSLPLSPFRVSPWFSLLVMSLYLSVPPLSLCYHLPQSPIHPLVHPYIHAHIHPSFHHPSIHLSISIHRYLFSSRLHSL